MPPVIANGCVTTGPYRSIRSGYLFVMIRFRVGAVNNAPLSEIEINSGMFWR